MRIDPRFLTAQGPEIFTGNELLVKGALEADGGVHLLGGYPGSPVAGFFDTITRIKDLLNSKGIRAVINNNEALAAAMLNGSQLADCRAMIVIKSVGVHVAADALALGNLAGASSKGGAIVVYGDDPWSDSTQVPSDSRFISKHLFIPTIEPSTPQEVKDFVDLGLKLSAGSELYTGYVLTTNLADGGGTVICKPNQYPSLNTLQKTILETAAIDLNKRVLLPPKTWWQEATLPERHQRAIQKARQLGLNRFLYPADEPKEIGFISSGLACAYLLQALAEMDLLGEFPILKFGMSYPIDAELVEQFARNCRRIVVVEERRGFLEEQVAHVLTRARQLNHPAGKARLWGKQFPDGLEGIPSERGLHPSILIDRLGKLFKSIFTKAAGIGGAYTDNADDSTTAGVSGERISAVNRELETIQRTEQVDLGGLPARLPTFCPGCPHRDTADLCLEIKKRFMDADYMKRTYRRDPVDLVFHGDTGCYTMLMYPPNTPLMHDYSGMGLGGGTGAGVDPFITNKQVVFMGDSTFFHSGQVAISQAVKLGQDITFIILDNRTTAMTGHQPTPGVEYDVVGNPTPMQDIEQVIRGMVPSADALVVRVNPERRKEYRRLLEKAFLADGVKVIIADKECGITRNRRKKREEREIIRRVGYLPKWEHMNVNLELCNFCLACAEMTGCPGLKHVQTDYGPKIDTDITWCVNDGACQRLGQCSAFERVIIKRKRPPKSHVPELGLDEIPPPPQRFLNEGDTWRCGLTGVGGMGCGVATTILVRAGHKEGYNVLFLDKKGLAIRNGGVVSQIVYTKAGKPTSQRQVGKPTTAVIPYGKCDLLIGIDVLEAARAIEPAGRMKLASTEQTAAVINTDKITTIRGLAGQEDFDPEYLADAIRRNTRQDVFLARNISRICEKYLGSKVYANVMMLGFAFQKGLLPVSMHSIAWAIKDTIKADFRKNLYAFNMGRKLVVQQDLFLGPPKLDTWEKTLDQRCRYIVRRYRNGRQIEAGFRELAKRTMRDLAELSEDDKRAVIVRVYDCLRWGSMDYATRYARSIVSIYKKDSADFGRAATRAVIYNLADAMLIKDAVFMAEVSTSPEKYARDYEKYNISRFNGDRISYRHFWHWEIGLGSRRWRLDVVVYDWMLEILKRARFLRYFLPRWHKSEWEHLKRYESVVKDFSYSNRNEYQTQLVKLSAARCIECMNPRCSDDGCPLESPIPRWIKLAYHGKWRESAAVLFEANPLAEITSRVCPAPCQQQCKRALSGFSVGIRQIEQEIADKAFSQGWVKPTGAVGKRGKKVAIIGSGPAGLAAAWKLAQHGHDVVVFEKEDVIGGLLRYGIPANRLERHIVARRVEMLKSQGVQFRKSIHIGKDISIEQIRNDFDAIVFAIGASRNKDLKVAGRNRNGIYFAIDLLKQYNLQGSGEIEAKFKDKVVAVIGAGLTGNDCVDLAISSGAKEVHQLEILPQPRKIDYTADELLMNLPNVHRHWCVSTTAFLGKDGSDGDGALEAIEAVKVVWKSSANGSVMQVVPDSKIYMQADIAILALGFEPIVPDEIARPLGLECDETGKIRVNRDFSTSVDGIFAVGDLATGPANVATAIDSSLKAADKIDEYLASATTVALLAK